MKMRFTSFSLKFPAREADRLWASTPQNIVERCSEDHS